MIIRSMALCCAVSWFMGLIIVAAPLMAIGLIMCALGNGCIMSGYVVRDTMARIGNMVDAHGKQTPAPALEGKHDNQK